MLPSFYEFYNPVKIVSGNKAVDNLPFELDQLGVKKPLIVTDKGVAGAGLIDIVLASLHDTSIVPGAVYDNTPPDSSIETVNEIAKLFRETGCDSIVAVGGGSPIDTAKGVNIVVTEESDDLMRFMGAEVLKKPMKPLVVIPTTSGTGSETTLVAVIANPEKNVKMLFTSYQLLPKVAILDPRMTLTCPPSITAATGMDALTHAMEAYISLQQNPLSDAYSLAAIELIRDHMLEAVTNGKNAGARMAMANASCMAGISFSNSMVGMVHGLGHAAGAVCHIPHGTAMSIFLPHGLEYNMEKSGKRIGDLLRVLAGDREYNATSETERPRKTIERVRELQKKLKHHANLPMTLREAGVPGEKLEEIARTALGDGTLMVNPAEVDYRDAMAVLESAYQ